MLTEELPSLENEDSNESDEASLKVSTIHQDVQPPPQKKAKNNSGKVKSFYLLFAQYLTTRYHLFYLQRKKYSKAIVPVDSSSDSEPEGTFPDKVDIGVLLYDPIYTMQFTFLQQRLKASCSTPNYCDTEREQVFPI